MEKLDLMRQIAERVNYNPETGVLTWKPRDVDLNGWNNKFSGKECGSLNGHGYRVLHVKLTNGRRVDTYAHRLAWLISYGTLPLEEIDHINQNRADNKLTNLRAISRSLNQRNKTISRNNKSGVIGVFWSSQHGKWQTQVRANGRHNYLGRFDDLAEAEKVVKQFRALHGFTENHGSVINAVPRTA